MADLTTELEDENFTANLQSKQATGTSGRFTRAESVRSAFTGAGDQTVSAPGAEVSEMDSSMFLGKQFGLSNKDIKYAMNPNFHIIPGAHGEAGSLDRDKLKEAGFSAGRGFGITSDQYNEIKGDFPGLANRVRAGGLSDEQAIFRSYNALSPKDRERLDLGDSRTAKAFARVGRDIDLSGVDRDTIRDHKPSKSGGNLMTKIGRVTIPALAGLVNPFAGAAMTSLMTGAEQGFTSPEALKTAALSFGTAGIARGIGGQLSGANQSVEAANLAPQTATSGGLLSGIKSGIGRVQGFLDTPFGKGMMAAGKLAKTGYGAYNQSGIDEDLIAQRLPGAPSLDQQQFISQSAEGLQQAPQDDSVYGSIYDPEVDLDSRQQKLVSSFGYNF